MEKVKLQFDCFFMSQFFYGPPSQSQMVSSIAMQYQQFDNHLFAHCYTASSPAND